MTVLGRDQVRPWEACEAEGRFNQAKADLNPGWVCDWLTFLHSQTTAEHLLCAPGTVLGGGGRSVSVLAVLEF